MRPFARIASTFAIIVAFAAVSLSVVADERPAVEDPIDVLDGANVLHPMIERYSTDRRALGRAYPTPTSPRARQRMEAFLADWGYRLEAVSFDALPHAGKVDYILLRNLLDHERKTLAHEAARVDAIGALAPFRDTIVNLADERHAMNTISGREAADALTAIKGRIDEASRAVRDETLTASTAVADRAVRRIGELREALERWHGFYDGYDPVFTWWTKKPYEEVDKALEEYAKLVRKEIVGVEFDDEEAIIGDPIGREALLDELAFEMIPYTPEELIAIAEREFAWCEAERIKAARDMGLGDDWRAAQEHVKGLHVAPGQQPDMIRELALEAVDFLEQRELLTIPDLAKEVWRMEMMTPRRQLMTPYFTGGEVISVSFPTDGMTHEQKIMSMQGNNRHYSRATVHHELIPGHHLQGYMNQRHRTYRRAFSTPFWGEGWALYWEMLLWDLDFPQSPEDRIGMLFWRSHRCARIIFSLSFHLELMTADEAVEFLIERVGHEQRNAAAEVRRSVAGDYGPLYQAAYMLGGLQFRALHRELVESGRMTNREFHDAILHNNSIPVEMVRATLINQALTKDHAASWRFADEND